MRGQPLIIIGEGVPTQEAPNTTLYFDSAAGYSLYVRAAGIWNLIVAASPSLVLPNGDIFVGSIGNIATAVAMSGDASIIASGAITVLKSGGVAFGSAAFQASSAFDPAGAAASVAATLTGGTTGQVLTKNSNTAFDYSWLAPALAATLNSGNIFVGNSSNVATGVAMSGDATIANTGAITVAKSGGVAFGSAAFQSAAAFDAAGAAAAAQAAAITAAEAFSANASNLSSGTVPSGLLPQGSIGTFGAVKVDGKSIKATVGVIAATVGIDQFTTVPANPGFDPAFTRSAAITLSNNNRTMTPVSSSPYNYCFGLPAKLGGKGYFEIASGDAGSFTAVGFTGHYGHFLDGGTGSPGVFGNKFPSQIGYKPNGVVWAQPTPQASLATSITIATVEAWTANQHLGFAIDIDALLFWVVNWSGSGNWNNNGANDPATGVGGLSLAWAFCGCANTLVFPGVNNGSTNATNLELVTANFFHAAPAGFASWSGL